MANLGSSVVYGILNATSYLKEAGQKLANKYAGKLSLSGTTLSLRNQEDTSDLDTQDLSGAVDSHLSGGTGINYSTGSISTDDANIDHDSLNNFVSNEHIDHSGVSISSGTGLSGGGDLTASRTLALDINSLTTETGTDNDSDYLCFYDASNDTHKSITPSNLVGSSETKQKRWRIWFGA